MRDSVARRTQLPRKGGGGGGLMHAHPSQVRACPCITRVRRCTAVGATQHPRPGERRSMRLATDWHTYF
jgi:hypothetical protein